MTKEKDRDNMVEVLTTFNAGELAVLKSVLDGENIPYLAQGEEFSIAEGGGTLPVRLLVPREHAGRARKLIAQMIDKRTQPPV